MFRVEALIDGGVPDRRSAHVYISRWIEAKLIGSIAPYSGIYFKILHDDRATDRCRRMAMLEFYPEAVLIGRSALICADWSPRECEQIHLAVLARPKARFLKKAGDQRTLGNFDLVAVDEDWFEAMTPWISKPIPYSGDETDLLTHGYRALSPAAALIDSYARHGGTPGEFVSENNFNCNAIKAAQSEIVAIGNSLNAQVPEWLFQNFVMEVQ